MSRELNIKKQLQHQAATDTLKSPSRSTPLKVPAEQSSEEPKRFNESGWHDMDKRVTSDTLQSKPMIDSAAVSAGTEAPVVSSDLTISASVGRGGVNDPADVEKIRVKLEALGLLSPGEDIVSAISEFQLYIMKSGVPDGRIDADGFTLRRLKETDAAGVKLLKKEKQQREEEKRKADEKAAMNAKLKAEEEKLKSARNAQRKAEAISKAGELISKHTNMGGLNLNEEALGAELAGLALTNPELILAVLHQLEWQDRDDVSSAIVSALGKKLAQVDKIVLRRLLHELDEGVTTSTEEFQMKLVKIVLGVKGKEKKKFSGLLSDPFNGKAVLTSGWLRKNGDKHGAFDYGVAEGSEVLNPAPGMLVLSSLSPEERIKDNYGHFVVINHGVIKSGDYKGLALYSLYGHLSSININKPGTVVGIGDVIGLSGNTGSSSGPHLHWEIFVSKTNSTNLATGVNKKGQTNFPQISKTLIPPDQFLSLYELTK